MESCDLNIEDRPEEKISQEETYSGETSYLYSSKITGHVNVASVCEVLVASEIFSFALDNHGKIFFKENGRLRTQILNIETTISELGMTVSGHNDFIKNNPGDSNAYSLSNALDLLLSDKKLFNPAFEFPTENARIFMRPIAIRVEGSEGYGIFVPYIRFYAGGIISISLSSVLGFESAAVRKIIDSEVNKSRLNIKSVLCEKEMHLACTECQIAQMPVKERVAQRKPFEAVINSALSAPQKFNFLEENLTVYELIHTDQFTLTDIARNFLSLVARAVSCGKVRTRINWIGKQYIDNSIGEYWHGKPILFIRKHTRQKVSSAENWDAHKILVNSVMARTYLYDITTHAAVDYKDMRNFDDFNNFYSEAVSLMLSSAKVDPLPEGNDYYNFRNISSDVQALNESSHFIQIYYAYASLGVDKCKTSIDLARIELNILGFEESLISAHKYREVANYIEEVKRGNHLKTVFNILHKKIEIVRKSLELDEKISSESYTRRITIIFGIIASATLSPELMQPLAKFYGITFMEDYTWKLFGIGASVVVVIFFLIITNYVFRHLKWIARRIRS